MKGDNGIVAICKFLQELKVPAIAVLYDGSGDSGNWDEVFALSEAKSPDEVGYDAGDAELTKLVRSAPIPDWLIMPVRTQDGKVLDEIAYKLCDYLPGGWEINEGSFGTIVLDTMSCKISINHGERITNVEYSDLSYDCLEGE
jgi:hypothetical protein